MKIAMIGSMNQYSRMELWKEKLTNMGFEVVIPRPLRPNEMRLKACKSYLNIMASSDLIVAIPKEFDLDEKEYFFGESTIYEIAVCQELLSKPVIILTDDDDFCGTMVNINTCIKEIHLCQE